MRKITLLLVTITFLGPAAAYAGTCQWRIPPTNVAFGVYSTSSSTPLNAVSTYEFRCSPNTEGILTFTTGSNSSSYFPRYMAGSGTLLPYNLYDDAAGSTVLGDGTGGTTSRAVVNGTPQNKDFTGTIYGITPQGTDVPPGTYTDTVTAILSWDNFSRSSTVSFTVSTIVQAECTVTTSPLAFGNYDPVRTNATAPLDATGVVNVYCTPGAVGTVSLSLGLYSSGATRRMAGPDGSFLDYQLFSNAERTAVWSTAPNTVSGTSTTLLVPINGGMVVYGRIPAGQDPVVGTHADTVQATVNY